MDKQLFRKELKQFKPYVPGKPIEEVMREYGLEQIEKLASNENQLGPSPKAMEAVVRAVKDINFYPESTAIDLKKDLAEHLKVREENLVIGNGGEETLYLIAQTFINEGDEIIVESPSFGIYNTTNTLMGAVIRQVPYKDKKTDIDGIFAGITPKTKLVYICNPNNPTGNIISKLELECLLKGLPEDVVLILDEAYYEYACANPDYPNGINYLSQRQNLIILRTFSKVYGIAGLRIGYLITSDSIASEINKIKPTFNASRIAQEAARAALKDEEHLRKTVELNRESLKIMEQSFKEMDLPYIKSSANFVFVDVKRHSAGISLELLRKGIIIRAGHFWGWDNWIRVSTGTLEQTRKFIQCLKQVLSGN